jgi:hypothetical protein
MAEPTFWEPGTENVLVTNDQPLELPCEISGGWTPSMKLTEDQAGPALTPATDGVMDLVYSADLHFIIPKDPTNDMDHVFVDVATALPDGNGIDDDGDGAVDEPFDRKFSRCYDTLGTAQKQILTMPLFTGKVRVTILGRDDDVDANGQLASDPYDYCDDLSMKYGADVTIDVKANQRTNNDC